MLWILLGLRVAFSAEPSVVLPSSEREIEIATSVAPAVEEALALLGGQQFESAARAFAALADAGGGADLRWLEAVAWYEAGQPKAAERAARSGVAAPGGGEHAALHALLGLVLIDLGRGDEAAGVLATGERLARAVGDEPVHARVETARSLLALDRGDATAARAHLAAASALAPNDAEIAAVVAANEAVAEVLEGARSDEPPQPGPPGTDRRSIVRALLDQAATARATGNLDLAAERARQALASARAGGLVRECAVSLAEIGRVATLVGENAVARDRLLEAVGLVAGTSFDVLEAQVRLEAARVAVRLGDLETARTQLSSVRATALGLPATLGPARVGELEGEIAAASGDPSAADAAFERAAGAYEQAGWWPDAGRVGAAAVRAWAGRDSGRAEAWRARSLAAFSSAKDPLGPVHVAMADGLGRAARQDLDGALRSFAAAGVAARAAGSARLERIAEDNATQALLALGHAEGAAAAGLEGAVARHETMVKGESAYNRGLAAYEQKSWPSARDEFSAAIVAFDAIGEKAYADLARRGAAWSSYHDGSARGLSAGAAAQLVQQADKIGDAELAARSAAVWAAAAAAAGSSEAPSIYEKAAQRLESLGLNRQAAWAWADLSALQDDVSRRVASARRAFVLTPSDPVVVHAMYGAAVHAHNMGDSALALTLVDEIGSHGGRLAGAIDEVRRAASEVVAGG